METDSILLPPKTTAGFAADAAERPIPASSGQRRLWFLEQMEPGSPLYNIPYLLRLSGALNEEALRRALRTVVGRHEALRTNFVAVASEPTQVVATKWRLEMPVTDLTTVDVARRDEELARLAKAEAKKSFDLQHDLMVRVRLYRLAPTEHALMLTMHHIASDGWSMAVLYREIGTCYEAFTRGAEPALAELPIQYSDFADWQAEYLRGETLGRLVEYWKKKMAGAPALLEFPADHSRPPLQSHRGDTVAIRLPAELVVKLKHLAQQNRVTFFMVLLAGFKAVIHRYTARTDLVIGTPLAGRDAAETEGLVGFFINTVLMRTDLSGDPTVKELLARVRDVALEAFEYREMSYEKLVEELQPSRNLSFDPICQVFFALQNMPTAPLKLPGVQLSIAPVYTGTAKSDLTVWAIEQADGTLEVTAEYALDLFTGERMQRFLLHFETLLEGMVANADEKISRLPLLTAGESRRALVEWNATHAEYPTEVCVHELFEAQVLRTPEATALVFDAEELTYAALDARANALAALIRRHGAGPDVLVGVCVERSLEMMVALLAILKAGAAYVPLDPAYPKERIAFMLEDSQAPVLVTQKSLLPKLPAHQAVVVCVDEEARASSPAVESQAGGTPALPTPENLAYVLYTSGS
ncbi:MAG: condensation domain-containing protein, partial [Opitutaceae bacterium]